MSTAIFIILVLSGLLIGSCAFFYWFIHSEMKDRRKHYQMIIVVKKDNTLGTRIGKWVKLGRESIVVMSAGDKPVAGLDVILSNGQVKVTDMRIGRG